MRVSSPVFDHLPIVRPSPALLAVDIVLFGALLFGALAWTRLVWSQSRNPAATIVHGLFALYLAFLFAIVLLPLHGIASAAHSYDGTHPLRRAWEWGMQLHSPYGDGRFHWQRGANVMLTIPLGFGFGLLAPRLGVRKVLISCIAWAVSLEFAQLTISVLLGVVYRTFDINDIIDNTLGASIGLALFVIVAFAIRDSAFGATNSNTTIRGYLRECVDHYFAAYAARRGWDERESG